MQPTYNTEVWQRRAALVSRDARAGDELVPLACQKPPDNEGQHRDTCHAAEPDPRHDLARLGGIGEAQAKRTYEAPHQLADEYGANENRANRLDASFLRSPERCPANDISLIVPPVRTPHSGQTIRERSHHGDRRVPPGTDRSARDTVRRLAMKTFKKTASSEKPRSATQ